MLLEGHEYTQNSVYSFYFLYKSELCQILVFKINTFLAFMSLNSRIIEGVRLILAHLSCLILHNRNYFSLNKNDLTFCPLFTITLSTNAPFFKFVCPFYHRSFVFLATIVSRNALTLTEISILLLRGGDQTQPWS